MITQADKNINRELEGACHSRESGNPGFVYSQKRSKKGVRSAKMPESNYYQKIKKFYSIYLLFSALVVSYLLCGNASVLADDPAIMLHEKAWSDVIDKAQTDKYYKYGIYASRVLAVKHPEVYLQADMLFIDTVNNKELHTLTGARSKAFETKPITFSLDKLDLAKYTIINSVQFYPPEAPIFGYLDRRVLSPAVTLRKKSGSEIVEQDKIKQIELASLYYIKECQKTQFEDLYIIYCDNEDAYLWLKGELIFLKTLKPCEIISSGNPILIFNEKYVWYPLMKRDDTKRSRSLNNLVEKYKTDIQKPSLSETEEKLLQKLLLDTELTGPEYDMAILSAAKVSSFYGFGYRDKNKEISRKWHELFPDLTERQIQSTIPPHPAGGLDDVILEQISKRANYLSPVSAYLAALGKDKDKNSIALIGKKYRELGFEWNCLWTLGFEEATIDESFFSHGGTCEVHANNFSSILNLLGVDNIIIHGYKIGESTHQIVYIPEYDWIFTNVRLMSSQGTILYCPKAIFMISDKDSWAIIVKNSYIGTMSPSQAVEKLQFLKAKYEDDIKGINLDKEVSEISFEKLTKYLKEKDKTWRRIGLP